MILDQILKESLEKYYLVLIIVVIYIYCLSLLKKLYYKLYKIIVNLKYSVRYINTSSYKHLFA